ncbi:DNA-directed RNA polymerase V subunit 1 [Datura stramonium]|uniref:DNA-directed RNA polymerase n=1 Tax=Datura stramonium TaxID=4076 RepID=A0ABS8S1E3_DATST|nr:DNA-directed RNA polymerase V subunit 1 [Datura stramonium]
MMKEILLCGVSFKNDVSDRRVILYLNDCGCRRGYCREKAAYVVKNHLSKVCLKDAADEFLIEYVGQQGGYENSETGTGLIGHIRLNQGQLENLGISVLDVLERCQENICSFQRKKKIGNLFKRIVLSVSEFCSFCHNSGSKWLNTPCLRFSWPDASCDDHLERVSHILADMICPILLDTVIKGDPRVSSANIAWISPDTMSWFRSPSKSERGELALDIVLEKEAVKQRGDAWRILMDSCLPVIHLIDTTRSIPYAIKQVQELIGISCAFEQAVKRLSTSVTMVTKGVLRDHLVLLANSMTCAGNLIGFNAGGIKALSRSLNVQIPFTEATLFTPRKCFERAAEKCHVDSLSSIVASCSWGKHVAVGTGSRFEVLLNTKNVEWNIPETRDVYSFLHLVRSSSAQEVEGTSCLGAEVDELEEDEDMGLYLSPNRDSGSDMPTFEDRAEFDYNENLDEGKPSGSAWEKASSENVKSGGSWDMAGKTQDGVEKGVNQSDSWSSWGKKAGEAVSDPHRSGNGEQLGSPSAWGEKVKEADSNPQQSGVIEQSGSWSAWGKKSERDGGSSWGQKVDEAGNSLCQSGNEEKSGSLSSWGKNVETHSGSRQSGKEEESVSLSSWGKKVEKDGGSSWGKKVDKDGGSWGKKVETENSPQLSGKEEQSGSWSSWGKQVEKDGEASWGKKVEKDGGSSWGKKVDKNGGSWGNKVETENSPQLSGKEEQSGSFSSWGKPVEKDGGSSWGKKVDEPENNPHQSGSGEQSGSWSSWGKKVEKHGGSRVKKVETHQSGKEEESGSLSSWGKKVEKDGGSSWGEKVDKNGGSWGKKVDKDGGSWGKKVETETSPQLSGKEEQSGSFSSWGKQVEKDGGSSWGKKVNEPESNPNQSGNGEQSGSWSSWGKKVEKDGGSWDGPKQSNTESSWGKATKGGGLGSATAESNRRLDQSVNDWSSSISGDGKLNESTRDDSTKNGGWNSSTVGGWDSQKVGVEENDKQPQWGQRRRNSRGDFKENSRGWGSASGGEWKNNRPARSADDSNRGGNFTATRQKMDIFTAEEQDILSEVDPIMLKIRKIMHGTGYNDGDPLSADDQSYVIDTVLNYHPDKAVKMGAGLDYIMVSKHTDFQDTRCFYVVSTDGAKQDFSTRKCLENFIRSKYPDKAETFNGKYFKKPPPRVTKIASPSPSVG